MKKKLIFWIEEYFYTPNSFQIFISFFLLPISWLYCFVIYLIFLSKKPKDMGIAVVGIGNLSVGGSGKTPLVTELASRYDNCAVVLRGYGRESSGLIVVKDKNSIRCNVSVSGDEAMIYAHKLPSTIVIVSEDRQEGIKKAKEMGVDLVFLDDAYSKHDIKKLDIVINVKSQNESCLPSGPFREKLYKTKETIIIEEDIDFKRITVLNNKKDKMSLVTAIARPSRLDKYIPNVLNKHYFEDHHIFKKEELIEILKDDKVESLLVTYKDFVKIEDFNIPLSLLDMSVEVDNKILNLINKYIEDYYAKKN